mgnify:CR=1 FL=1
MPTEPQSQPLVSIIVPVYNAADHIARCIESIRRQTYRNLEIILLNDGSKDVSYAVCQSYAGIDRRIVVIDKNPQPWHAGSPRQILSVCGCG